MHSIFWFRTRQWVLSRVLHLTEHKKQTLLAAPDAVLLLPALFRKRRISRILLVTTPGFVRRGTLTSLLDGCKKENISVTIFSEIAPDPQIESVEQGFRLYQQIQAQAILAIGGGSVLDAAKLIGARVCCPKKTVPAMRPPESPSETSAAVCRADDSRNRFGGNGGSCHHRLYRRETIQIRRQ